METARWGHLETVQFLIDNGAKRREAYISSKQRRLINVVRPDANKKRRQILACLTRHETIGWDAFNRMEPLQIHEGYSRKISSNLPWYYRLMQAVRSGPGRKSKHSRGLIKGCDILL